jgi:hypothetical protein
MRRQQNHHHHHHQQQQAAGAATTRASPAKRRPNVRRQYHKRHGDARLRYRESSESTLVNDTEDGGESRGLVIHTQKNKNK